MIDIHCHLLPGIDDGPDNMAQALELAQQAVDDGVTHSVVTPHIHPGRWNNDRGIIEKTLLEFRESLMEEGIPLFVGMAAEVRIGAEIRPMVERHAIPFLGYWGDRKVMLLELPHSHVPPGAERMVSWLMQHDILPMIAHPERNKDVMRDINKLIPFLESGCLFQVTAGAVAGQFGEPARERAVQLLEQGVVTVLASDAHHARRRPVNLSQGQAAASEVVGSAIARQLVRDNPLSIVRRQFKEWGCA